MEMNPFTLSYFDPALKKYVTLKEKSISLDLEGEVANTKVEITDTIASAHGEEEVLSVPISVEKMDATDSVPHSNIWIALLGGLVLLLGGVIYLLVRKRKKEVFIAPVNETDFVETEPVQPTKEDPYLTIEFAQNLASQGDYKRAYGTIHKIVSKSIQQRFNLANELISQEELQVKMQQAGYSEGLISDYFWVIRTCQEAEYAIWDTRDKWDEVILKSKELVRYFA